MLRWTGAHSDGSVPAHRAPRGFSIIPFSVPRRKPRQYSLCPREHDDREGTRAARPLRAARVLRVGGPPDPRHLRGRGAPRARG
jgi:hypothetical protein